MVPRNDKASIAKEPTIKVQANGGADGGTGIHPAKPFRNDACFVERTVFVLMSNAGMTSWHLPLALGIEISAVRE